MRPQPTRKRRLPGLSLAATLLLTLALLPLLPPNPASAFKPTDSWKGTPQDTSHEAVTEQAIKELIENENFIEGVNRITPQMQKAIDQIKKGNSSTDLSLDYFSDEAHFTGESFDAGRIKLISNRNSMIRYIRGTGRTIKSLSIAREFLGAATHAVQDFYSHTNWVESGHSDPYPNLGHVELGTGFTNVAGPNEATCSDCDKCRNCDNNITTSKLTSAYFGAYPNSTKPNGKCSHGAKAIVQTVPVPNPSFPYNPMFVPVVLRPDTTENAPARGGIAKDTYDCADSPHGARHGDAIRVALAGTKAYLRYVFKEAANIKPTPRELRAVFGVDETLAFAVDTTGSMGSAIAGVRTRLTEIINTRRGTELEPSRYVLAPFGDPDVGPLTVTEDPDEFIAAINGLSAGGGGDCPELSNQGMLLALSAMDDGGELMMVTDASSRDPQFGDAVRAVAHDKNVKVTTFALGSCSPIDPQYYRSAEATGGQVFVLSPSETSRITKLADFVIRPNAVELLSVKDTLAGAAKTYSVPVDSKTTRVTFSVSGTTALTLRRPGGAVVQATDAGVETVPLSSGAIYSVVSPQPGVWTLEVGGAGDLSVRVSGESMLNFSSFDFLQFVNHAGHEGYAPLAGAPLSGLPVQVLAELSAADVSEAHFELRALDGTTLQTPSLSRIAWPNEPGVSPPLLVKYSGVVTPPAVPFAVYAVGTDTSGQPFQRLWPGFVRTSRVKVNAPAPADLHPGRESTYTFAVENVGPQANVRLSVRDEQGYVVDMTPKSLLLGRNESRSITVRLRPPADAEDNTLVPLTFTARNLNSPDDGNSATVGVRVRAETAVRPGAVNAAPQTGDGDAVLEPGETAVLNVPLVNAGAASATGVSAMIATLTPGVEITAGRSAYADLAPSAEGSALTPFTFRLSNNFPCAGAVSFAVFVRHEGQEGGASMYQFTVPVGELVTTSAPPQVFSYAGPPAAIPDSNAVGVEVPLAVEGVSGNMSDLDFSFDGNSCTTASGATTVGLDHTWVSDLVVTLTSPQGTTVKLVNHAGGSGNNFCHTVLDDDSGGALIDDATAAGAPFAGSFEPSSPLGAFAGENPNGVWKLRVVDEVGGDVGSVRAFSLSLRTGSSEPSCQGEPGGDADLAVSFAGPSEPVPSGAAFTYVTKVTNNGPAAASGVRLEYALPAGVSVAACSASTGGACGTSGGAQTALFDTLAPGETATVWLTAAADCPLADGSQLTATVLAGSATTDPNPLDNLGAALITVSNPPPAISTVTASKTVLWPPNHQMIEVAIDYSVTDNCGALTNSLSVASNEPTDGPGDGHTSVDWEVLDAHRVRLRAERAGAGTGRVYTVTVTSADSAGNTSTRDVQVRVPHNAP